VDDWLGHEPEPVEMYCWWQLCLLLKLTCMLRSRSVTELAVLL
jgi:hypothetical protein